jgi:hypothetical protein
MLLYGLVILRLERRRLLWINATANPTAEWIARQITEAFPWEEAPRYLIRDRGTSIRGGVHQAAANHGHSRSANRPTIAMAEWTRRTTDPIDPARVP